MTFRASGENLILDICVEDLETEGDEDGSDWLPALAPLRADVLGADLRLFYLLWLRAVAANAFKPDELEPMPGIGPMTDALNSFAYFFKIDPDLVAAAAEHSADPAAGQEVSHTAVAPIIAALSDQEKTALLMRLFDGAVHVGSELRALVRARLMSKANAPRVAMRTVGDLRARAAAIRHARERAQRDKAATEHKKLEAEAQRARRARLNALLQRGESVWREIETEIERRNASGYDRAAALLLDLKAIATEQGTAEDFARRLRIIRERHARKERFIERLVKLG